MRLAVNRPTADRVTGNYRRAMAEERVHGVKFERRMSDFEALMWNVEKDPWLNPSGGVVMVLDRPIDMEDYRRRMEWAVAETPRLRERVVPGLGRLSPPRWAPDPEFDLGNHIRHVALPSPGTERQLYDFAAQLMQDPFDRTRPLWLYVVIDGLEGGRGAVFAKLHHTIADGIAALRLSEAYLTSERDAPLPPVVDLERLVAEAVEADRTTLARGFGDGAVAAAAETAGYLWRRQLGRARRAAGEAVMWGVHPSRPLGATSRAFSSIGQMRSQLGSGGGEVSGGSPLWRRRSRHRHLEAIRVPLDPLRAAGKALGGTVNDVFVAASVEGAVRYHQRRDSPLDALNISFVVSTRGDHDSVGNSFAATRVQVPAGPMSLEERFVESRDRMAIARQGVRTGGAMGAVAGLANLLPTSVVTGVARSQTARVDFATSNLRGAPFQTYTSGARILWMITLGPVAGTAFNLTALSSAGSFDMGLHVDPVAVEDPADLRRCIEDAFVDLLAAGGQILAPVSAAAD